MEEIWTHEDTLLKYNKEFATSNELVKFSEPEKPPHHGQNNMSFGKMSKSEKIFYKLILIRFLIKFGSHIVKPRKFRI